MAGSLHSALLAAVLCLARGCAPAALAAALQLPGDGLVDLRAANILQLAQLVWDSPFAAQPSATIAAKVRRTLVPGLFLYTC